MRYPRRSICTCKPAVALAGEVSEWSFVYSTGEPLPKGTKLKFDLASDGRPIDWQLPEAGSRKNSNTIYGIYPDESVLHPKEIEGNEFELPQFEFTLSKELEEGAEFTIMVGTGHGKKGQGNACQTTVQRRRPFLLYVDPKGKGRYDDPEVFLMDVRGNALHTIRVIAPSFAVRNKRFDIVVRFEDAFGNLTSNAPEDTLIELSHEHLRDNLNWKLFVPETGFLTLPNIYFNEVGVYTIRLKNLATGEEFCSCPIRCTEEAEQNAYWGLLHGESERVDSTESIESCFRHFRDDRAYHFYGVSPFESEEETPSDIWKLISQNVTDFNEDERFNSFLGFQWHGTKSGEGLRQFVFHKDNKAILRAKDNKYDSLKKIYKSISPNDVLSIPSFTMAKKACCNFEQFYPEFERVVEIYNAWGSSECTAKEGNPFPIKGTGKNGTKEDSSGSVIEALNRGCRFGFVAGGLDDRGIYTELFDSDQQQYHPGMTAILADTQGKDAMLKALSDRACYATTGMRIIVGFFVAGTRMGKEIHTQDKPGLAINRHIHGYVAGTADLESIEIIRNGKVLASLSVSGYSQDFAYDDMDPIDSVLIKAPDQDVEFTYYYLRVKQKDGHMAWSSPIWINHSGEKGKAGKKRLGKKA